MRSDAYANRAALMGAARRLIAARGADLTLSAVAEAAGIGIATLYRNFPTRADLFSAVIIDVGENIVEIAERFIPEIEADPERGWDGAARALVAIQPGALAPALSKELAADGIPENLAAMRGRVLEALQKLLEHAKDAGLVRADLTATQFQFGLVAVTHPFLDSQLPGLPHGDWLVDIYLHGLRP